MKKYSSLFKIISIFIFIVAFGGISSADQSGLKIPDQVTGDLAYDHVYYLSEDIGARIAGSPEEEETAAYIIVQFEGMGYDVEVQEFEYKRGGVVYYSQNIIATKTTMRFKSETVVDDLRAGVRLRGKAIPLNLSAGEVRVFAVGR